MIHDPILPARPRDGRSGQLLSRNVKRFRGGLVFKAHRLLYHSTLGSRVITKEEEVKVYGYTIPSFLRAHETGNQVFVSSDQRPALKVLETIQFVSSTLVSGLLGLGALLSRPGLVGIVFSSFFIHDPSLPPRPRDGKPGLATLRTVE